MRADRSDTALSTAFESIRGPWLSLWLSNAGLVLVYFLVRISVLERVMPKFVIEREIPGAGNLSDAELHAISQKSVGVLKEMGPGIQWLQSYVTGDKVYCV